jgi:hypothetical protein
MAKEKRRVEGQRWEGGEDLTCNLCRCKHKQWHKKVATTSDWKRCGERYPRAPGEKEVEKLREDVGEAFQIG